jgi:hypothetical protein
VPLLLHCSIELNPSPRSGGLRALCSTVEKHFLRRTQGFRFPTADFKSSIPKATCRRLEYSLWPERSQGIFPKKRIASVFRTGHHEKKEFIEDGLLLLGMMLRTRLYTKQSPEI